MSSAELAVHGAFVSLLIVSFTAGKALTLTTVLREGSCSPCASRAV
jgi:hypothetical protein